MAIKDKMDLAIGVAVGSSMQIALLVTPLMVLLGWIIGADMTLNFNTFETAILFITVLYYQLFTSVTDSRIVNYLIQDGKSNYLEGGLLMAVYIVYPNELRHANMSDYCGGCMVLSNFRFLRWQRFLMKSQCSRSNLLGHFGQHIRSGVFSLPSK